MTQPADHPKPDRGSLPILLYVNLGIWAISLIALIFVVQRCPSARGMFVILAGGTGVGISMLGQVGKLR